MEDNKILLYIATWSWIIVGMILLGVGAIASFLHNLAGLIGFALASAYCFYMSLKRKREVLSSEIE